MNLKNANELKKLLMNLKKNANEFKKMLMN